jgi:hypothetical protein
MVQYSRGGITVEETYYHLRSTESGQEYGFAYALGKIRISAYQYGLTCRETSKDREAVIAGLIEKVSEY